MPNMCKDEGDSEAKKGLRSGFQKVVTDFFGDKSEGKARLCPAKTVGGLQLCCYF